MNQDTAYQLLLRSFDESLTDAEQAQLNTALAASETLRIEKAQLEANAQLLGDLEKPSIPFFSGKVMTQIEQLSQQATFDINLALHQLFPKVAFASFTLIALLVGSLYLSEGALSLDAMAGLDASSELLVMDYWEVMGE